MGEGRNEPTGEAHAVVIVPDHALERAHRAAESLAVLLDGAAASLPPSIPPRAFGFGEAAEALLAAWRPTGRITTPIQHAAAEGADARAAAIAERLAFAVSQLDHPGLPEDIAAPLEAAIGRHPRQGTTVSLAVVREPALDDFLKAAFRLRRAGERALRAWSNAGYRHPAHEAVAEGFGALDDALVLLEASGYVRPAERCAPAAWLQSEAGREAMRTLEDTLTALEDWVAQRRTPRFLDPDAP